MQLEAARIVTGLTSYASTESLYVETGWEKLKTRRYYKKIILFYKIVNGHAPEYLQELVPPTVAELTPYNLRNRQNIAIQSTRLSIFQQSYFPSSIKNWNELNLSLRQQQTISQFKSKLKDYVYKRDKVPVYYFSGDRYLNVIHARLRNNCSSLKADLFRANLVDNSACECGHINESANHFLLECKKYVLSRLILYLDLNRLNIDNIEISTDLLLYGSTELPVQTNYQLFSFVQKYIKDTGRFTLD